jgi:hypothetical protein
MRARFVLMTVLSLLVSCRTSPPDGGTSVGNPGGLRLSMGAVSGATATQARIAVTELVWLDCGGGPGAVRVVNRSLDLLAPELLVAPPGTWCGVEVVPAAPLVLDLDGDAGGTAGLRRELGLAPVESATGFTVDETVELALELGAAGWLTAEELGLEAGAELTVEPGDAVHDGLASRARSASGLYSDDGDGVVSEEERTTGSLASAPAEDDDDDDDE